MIIDYVTGISKAFINNKINSSFGAKGIVKKVGYLCVITAAVILDQLLNANGSIRTIVLIAFIFNEMFSILENCSEMGIKIPDILYKSLEKLNKDQEEKDSK